MIRVKLIAPAARRFYLAQWCDPITEKTRTRSTGTANRREAERFAGRLEDELNAGTYKPQQNTLWSELTERYLAEVSASKALKTKQKTVSTINAIDKLVEPKRAASLTASVISTFQAKLRAEGLSEFTIHGHMRELRKILRWAVKMDLVPKMPHLEFPRLVGGMKGRPITGEELDRFIASIPQVVTVPAFVPSWERLTRGLWLSGLRLDEAMNLHWTSDRCLCPDFTHRRPMFRIQAASEKGRQFRLLPMTPDFAEFLLQTPEADRQGLVFEPLTVQRGSRKGQHRPTTGHVGKVLTLIGEKAGIKVNDTKDASAHDFRRAFGYRWSKLVMPKVLQELMRHESIQTTMAYYVGNLAEDAADAIWKAAAHATGNTLGNTSPKHGPPDAAKDSENTENTDESEYPRVDSNH